MKREQYRLIKIINIWLQSYKIKNYAINDDLTISVNNNVDISFKNLEEFPSYIQFYEIKGTFDCSENKLISLRGCPIIVTGNFYCYNNKLTSLASCPEIVEGKFFCHGNLRTFESREVTKLCDVAYINN
jgi:hypothetical protein